MKNDIVYRRATLDDVLKLSVLYKQVYIHTYAKEGVSDEFANFITRQFSPDRIKSHLLLDPDHIYVAEYNSNLVGVLELEFEKKCPVGEIIAPEVNKLYILDWFCGRGIGRELMKIAEHLALTRGSNKIWIWALKSNIRAVEFYKKMEYDIIGEAWFQMEVNKYLNVVMIKSLNENMVGGA